MGSIPVVVKSNLSPLYVGLPVIQLDTWDDLSLGALERLSKALPTDRRNMYFEHWADVIRSTSGSP